MLLGNSWIYLVLGKITDVCIGNPIYARHRFMVGHKICEKVAASYSSKIANYNGYP